MGVLLKNDGTVEILRDFVKPSDSRLSDSRDPNPHAATHADGGSDEITTALDTRAYPTPTGAVAGRPAPGIVGRRWFDPGTLIEYLDIGAAWVRPAPGTHASTHQHGGTDEVATATPAANAIPKADGTGKLAAGWIPSGGGVPAHASTHVDGGSDEITSALDSRAYPVLTGTFAARPVAGIVGREYHATDTNRRYLDLGGAWVLVAGDPGNPADVAAHATRHADGGADEITTALDTRAYPTPTGTHAARPAAGQVGRRFYETDTGAEFIDLGGAWVAPLPGIHGSTHQHGGSDEIAQATPGANVIPKAGAGGVLDPKWIFTDVVKQAADASNSTVTLANTDLVFSYVAGGLYLIDLYILFRAAAATTGIALAWDTSSAVNWAALSFSHVLANTGTLTGGDAVADATKRGISSGVNTAAVDVLMIGQGLISAAIGSGTARLQFASEVAASAITFRQNSAMRVMKA